MRAEGEGAMTKRNLTPVGAPWSLVLGLLSIGDQTQTVTSHRRPTFSKLLRRDRKSLLVIEEEQL